MLFPKIRHLLSALLGAVCLTGFTTLADETNSETATNTPAALRTIIKNEEVLNATNAKPIRRAYFSSGTNRFAFCRPGRFKLDASNPGKIILTSPDYSGFISVQLMNPAHQRGGWGWWCNHFANLAADEFPSGNIVGEFGMRAANQSGPAYELSWKNSEGAQQLACVGFVPSNAGFLKFSFLSNSEKIF